jgi:glycine/D-amino acid oxidase-like deaminating enzyme
MDLRSNYPFWLIYNGLLQDYPPLTNNLRCDVVVIGGGITGALVAHTLVEQGIHTIVLDKREVGWGSTLASTAMLQYEIDTELHDLARIIGEDDARRCYQLGIEAIEKLTEIIAQLGVDCGFHRAESLYVTRRRKDVARLKREFEARRAAGFCVRWIEADALAAEYKLSAHAGIISEVGAQVDAYRLTHALLARAIEKGLAVFDRTEVVALSQTAGGVNVETDRGCTIHARKVVYATGYETQQILKQKTADLKSTYALVTEPGAADAIAGSPYLLWESARPYFYLRTTHDKRILLGGADEDFRDPDRRDRLIPKKREALLKQFARFYPDAPPLESAFAWAGTFGETKDGLAYIGETEEVPNAYFALGYGGNGITFSMIAADIIADQILGKENPDARLFRFDR